MKSVSHGFLHLSFWRALLATALLLGAGPLLAQDRYGVKLEELSWMDRNQMTQQVEHLNRLAGLNFGAQLEGQRSDLAVLQRLLDEQLVAADDVFHLQGMGVALGNVLVNQVPQLHWQVYEDEKGRSRAVCAQGTRECVFPVTMISRRIALRMQPDIEHLYNRALATMEPHLPQLPYGARHFNN